MTYDQDPTARGAYVVLARFSAKSGEGPNFSNRMKSDRARVRALPGVRQYELHGSYDDPTQFMLYEEFDNEAAWASHQSKPELDRLKKDIGPMLANAPERSVWSSVPLHGGAKRDLSADGHATLVFFQVRAGVEDTMIQEIAGDTTRAHGLLRFDLNRNPADARAFMICARWTDREAWQAHQSVPEYIAFGERVASFYEGPRNRTLWAPPG